MDKLSSSEIKHEFFQLGDLIFREGDPGFHFYIIDEGEVEIFSYTKSGEKLVLTTLTAGEAFGEFALLDHSPRSASARALVDSKIVRVSEKGYEHMLAKLPMWATAMMKAVVSRLKYMNEQVTNTEQFIRK